jgi:tRNA modification GTPase
MSAVSNLIVSPNFSADADQKETIAAIATPPGRGGVGVVRLSGPQAPEIAEQVVGPLPKPRLAAYRRFKDAAGKVLDQGLVLYFPAPRSFTGEAIVELQGHGGPIVLNLILARLLTLGARLARPGEFSERAFLNDRLDLAQAEAVADLIHASSEQAARAAMRSLQGEFSRQVEALSTDLIHLRAYVEAAIDFAEEEIDFLSNPHITQQLEQLLKQLNSLKQQAKQGQRVQEGLQLVIAGPPNAGKSSLLNALSGQDTAIVTAVPGTTRDVLHITIHLEGLPIHIMDTAGLRLTEDVVEQEGVRRALSALSKADQILWLVDSTNTPLEDKPFVALEGLQTGNLLRNQHPNQSPVLVVRNKADLSGEAIGLQKIDQQTIIHLSALTGEGVDLLKDYLKQQVGYESTFSGFSARQRHVNALLSAAQCLQEGLADWQTQPALEILALQLNITHQYLGEITGKFTSEDLLAQIFSHFCIGK